MRNVTSPMVLVAEGVDATPAVARGIKVAFDNDTELKLLDITPTIPEESRATLSPSVLSELRAALRERHEARLLSFQRMAAEAGLPVKTVLREGTPFLIAIREALAGAHDLVLKTAGDGGADGPAFAATDKHLLRKCPCPVWLVTPGAPDSNSRILAAVDPAPMEPEQEQLSRDVLRAAMDVAQSDDALLDVLHAWQLFGESVLRGPGTSLRDPEVDHLVGNTLNRHASAMERLLESVPNSGVRLKQHLVRGRPEDAIASFVTQNDTDLLVMGSVGRAGIPGLLIGNTAERLTDSVRCSVLALKPHGFISPVTLDDRAALSS